MGVGVGVFTAAATVRLVESEQGLEPSLKVTCAEIVVEPELRALAVVRYVGDVESDAGLTVATEALVEVKPTALTVQDPAVIEGNAW